jgi:predicted nucleotidyltransferase
MSTDSVVETLETYFRQTPTPLVCAYLYGSRARGEEHAGSDVDVAVLLQGATPPQLGGTLTTLRGELERLLRRPVDLIDVRRAPLDLVHRILRDGKLLVERDLAERVRFEVRARNEYFDLLPHLRRYRGFRAA